MKLVVQRVSCAKVTNKHTGKVCGDIQSGLFVLVGIGKGDGEDSVDEMANKLSKLRVISDDQDKMNLSVLDSKKEILVVSQFTLYANTTAGNRPSFVKAEEPARAQVLYQAFVSKLKGLGIKVSAGCFGEYMEIEATLDGPVTIFVESKK